MLKKRGSMASIASMAANNKRPSICSMVSLATSKTSHMSTYMMDYEAMDRRHDHFMELFQKANRHVSDIAQHLNETRAYCANSK